jgi:hypothetical protein
LHNFGLLIFGFLFSYAWNFVVLNLVRRSFS